MRSVKFLVAAGAASLLSSAAFAADMPSIMPPPPMNYAPLPVEDFGGWYLRGDIGFSNQHVDHLNNVLDANNLSSDQRLGFDTAGVFGLGVGYQFNNWLRGDITGQFRGNANFHGLDVISFNNGGTIGNGADTYSASKSEWLFLANAYADLGTWWCITPFVGAGIGTARVQISNFVDQGVGSLFPPGSGVGPSMAFADNASRWNFAWALHAGLAYKVSPNMTIELAYSYINMGDGITGDLKTFDGTNNVVNPMTFRNITSQDLTLGVRWQFDTPQTYEPPPLVTKG